MYLISTNENGSSCSTIRWQIAVNYTIYFIYTIYSDCIGVAYERHDFVGGRASGAEPRE